MLFRSYLRETPCLWTARRWLVKTGEFLVKLSPLAVFEFHGYAHPRCPAVIGSGLVPHYDPLDGRSLAEELFTLGLGQRPVVPVIMRVMMKQWRDSPQGTRERNELNMRTARADSTDHGLTRPTVSDLRTGLREDYGASGDSAALRSWTGQIPVLNVTRGVIPGGDRAEPVACSGDVMG